MDIGTEQAQIKRLVARERELLTLQRKHDRAGVWLSVVRALGAAAGRATGRVDLLRHVAECLKNDLSFQQVAFFERTARSLRPIAVGRDGAPSISPISGSLARMMESREHGRSQDARRYELLKRALGLEQFLWHWTVASRRRVLLVAGYDAERAPFYPPFDDTDVTQFSVVGTHVDLLLRDRRSGRGPSALRQGPATAPVTPRRSNEARSRVSGEPPPRVDRHELSKREVEVSRWLSLGKSNKEVATILGISPRTVQIHVSHIFDKIGVRGRAAAASWLVERTLVPRPLHSARTTRG